MSAAGRTLDGTERPDHIAISLLGDDGSARAAAPPIHLFFEVATPAEVGALCESAARSSDLEACLRAGAVDTVLITGVATNVCCEATARDAMMRDLRTIMVSDCLAALIDEEHNASLSTFYLYFGDVQASD